MRKDFGGSGEKGVSKYKIVKAKYEDKLEFPEGLGGGGVRPKNLLWEPCINIF